MLLLARYVHSAAKKLCPLPVQCIKWWSPLKTFQECSTQIFLTYNIGKRDNQIFTDQLHCTCIKDFQGIDDFQHNIIINSNYTFKHIWPIWNKESLLQSNLCWWSSHKDARLHFAKACRHHPVCPFVFPISREFLHRTNHFTFCSGCPFTCILIFCCCCCWCYHCCFVFTL